MDGLLSQVVQAASLIVRPAPSVSGIVTFYLGANLVSHLGTDPVAVDRLLEAAERAAGLLELLEAGTPDLPR